MKSYNVLCTLFAISIICSDSFCMKQPKKILPQKISQQLIVTHNVEKQETELLNNIIEYYPAWAHINDPDQKKLNAIDFTVYTPQYFKDSIKVLSTFKTGETTEYENTLKQQAVLYITYVATNNKQWPTINDKLSHIKECFQQYTLSYLEATWERYRPKMVITTTPSIAEELPYEKGTVEEVSSEEEEKTILEKPIPSIKTQNIKEIHTKITKQPYSAKATKGEPKQPKQSSIIYHAINFIWNGISSVFKWVFSWFK